MQESKYFHLVVSLEGIRQKNFHCLELWKIKTCKAQTTNKLMRQEQQ
jgi:hypothetical protein